MAQTFSDDTFAPGNVAQTDLANIEANFAALKSTFSGTGAPANQVAGMQWFDTDNYVVKYRDAGDSAWLGLMHGDASQKVWIYRNTAMNGWVVDGAVSDVVLALKGGTTYTTGAATAGSWTVSGLSDSGHTHASTLAAPNHTHTLADSSYYPGGDMIGYLARNGAVYSSGSGGHRGPKDVTGNPTATALTGSITSATATIASAGTWRAAAAVGTLQYLNL